MTKRNLLAALGTAALGISLAALPGRSQQSAPKQDNSVAALKREIAELKAKLAASEQLEELQAPEVTPELVEGPEIFVDKDRTILDIEEPEVPQTPPDRQLVMSLDG